jgi:hypothetical protein
MMGASRMEVSMRRRLTWRGRQLALALCGCSMMLAVAVRAQQAPAVGANLVPVTAASLLQYPETYVNQSVSMYATVEQLLSGTAFSVDQDAKKASLTDLLIVAPTLTAPPKAGAYVTVVGVVLKFDPAEIQKRSRGYNLDLPPNVQERYRGKVMVLASAVVDATMVDLAKVLPKPMTPEEEALSKVMKQVNPAVAELRKGADGSDKAIVTAQAQTLGKFFVETRKIFETQKDMADAVGWSTDAVNLMAAIEKSASAGQFAEVTASATKLTALCQQCHAARRERLEDGTYRIKR